jgi:NAD(P)-dependent dehydrogenase (short-subunit alcohol dehydrogenase family)
MTTGFADRFSLAGKVAIVTGGAGGIGGAIASAFAQAGARVAIADLSAANASRVSASIDNEGGSAIAVELDGARESDVERVFADVFDRFGHIDVLVNCAGIARRETAVQHSLDAWNTVLAVNATGTFLCSRAAAKRMMTTGGGAIVNIASIMGLSGGGLYPNISYQTSKGAVVNMTRALALEWAKDGIRVNAIAPTYVRTEFIKALVDDPALRARIEAMTPLGRIAEPDDIVGAALFLASPASSMVTGHVLAVDGGFLAQ